MGAHSRRSDPDAGGLITDQLRDAIEVSGESYYALAQRTGVSRQQISRFMAGERDLRFAEAAKLCVALELHLSSVRRHRKL